MIQKTCRCGATKKNFVVDIGDFFIDDCCVAAGYDHLGNKKLEAEDLGLTNDELSEAISEDSGKDLSVSDEGELPDPNEELEAEAELDSREPVDNKEDAPEQKLEDLQLVETPQQAKARKKAENKAAKLAKEAAKKAEQK